MSFFKRLFGGAREEADSGGDRQVGETVEHKGFAIRATPFAAEGQFQTCGVISGTIDGELKEHRFIRADRFATADVAADMAIRKGRQIIDEQGTSLFN